MTSAGFFPLSLASENRVDLRTSKKMFKFVRSLSLGSVPVVGGVLCDRKMLVALLLLASESCGFVKVTPVRRGSALKLKLRDDATASGFLVWDGKGQEAAPPQAASDFCEVPSDDEMIEAWSTMMRETRLFDLTIASAPFVVPLTAALSYEKVARFTRLALDHFGQRNNWVAVDGNSFEIAILAPVINGIVMPSVSIALGTLVATTVSTLRQRQVDVRDLLNSELQSLEQLRAAIANLKDTDFDLHDDDFVPIDRISPGYVDAAPTWTLTNLVRDYVSRLISEAKPDFMPQKARVADTELGRLSLLLYKMSDDAKTRAVTAAAAARIGVSTLADLRSERLAKLAATYPSLHYMVLALCGLSIISAFLLESDQEILRFLDAIQLRILFTMLVGAFAGLSTLLLDLADLHRGTLRITPIAVQFFLLRDYLTFDLCKLDGPVFESSDDEEDTAPTNLPYLIDGLLANPPSFSASSSNNNGARLLSNNQTSTTLDLRTTTVTSHSRAESPPPGS